MLSQWFKFRAWEHGSLSQCQLYGALRSSISFIERTGCRTSRLLRMCVTIAISCLLPHKHLRDLCISDLTCTTLPSRSRDQRHSLSIRTCILRNVEKVLVQVLAQLHVSPQSTIYPRLHETRGSVEPRSIQDTQRYK